MPETFPGKKRIAAALKDQISFQGTVTQYPIKIEPGFPQISRTQQFQASIGGQYFYCRGRITRGVLIQQDDRLAGIQINHINTDGTYRNFVSLQDVSNTLWQSGNRLRSIGMSGQRYKIPVSTISVYVVDL